LLALSKVESKSERRADPLWAGTKGFSKRIIYLQLIICIYAHSITENKEKFEIINDFDLLAIIGFRSHIMNGPGLQSLKDLKKEWGMAMHHGPGLIDLELEKVVANAYQDSDFSALLLAITDQVSQYNEKNPGRSYGIHSYQFRKV